MTRSARFACGTCLGLAAFAILTWASVAWSGEPISPSLDPDEVRRRGVTGIVLFWAGATVVMAIVGRFVFREQINELRTQRALIHRIGPFFPEFDIDGVRLFVDRFAPHVWHGWQRGDPATLAEYATPAFLATQRAEAERRAARGHTRECQLQKVLKVHTLGLSPAPDHPPPAGAELVLRIESRGVDLERDAQGRVVSGNETPRQIQHFWTLRHDGHRWWLHHVELAERDRVDLGKRPRVPPIMEWRRPEAPIPPEVLGPA